MGLEAWKGVLTFGRKAISREECELFRAKAKIGLNMSERVELAGSSSQCNCHQKDYFPGKVLTRSLIDWFKGPSLKGLKDQFKIPRGNKYSWEALIMH